MKKTICVLFIFIMTASAFVLSGCTEKHPAADTKKTSVTAADPGAATVETTAVPVETEAQAELPDINYGGRTIRVLVVDRGQDDIYTQDHMTGNAMHDAVFTRNQNICDRFGVKFEVLIETEGEASNKLHMSVNAGTDEYDICYLHMVLGATNAMNNDVLPFSELPYVDLSKPWWDKDISDGFSIKGNLMMANGDISPFSFGCTACLYFNKKLFDKYDFEYPYKLVEDGKWTLDKLIEFTEGFTSDQDGDGSDDQYGLTAWYLGLPYDFYYGAGGRLVTKGDDDVPFYDPQQERDTAIYEKIYRAVITNRANYEQSEWGRPIDLFSNGRALFLNGSLNDADRLREMDDEFGILPEPKFNESQKEYRSFVNGSSAMICVPATVRSADRECISVILEALASESYKIVTPVFVEKLLKRKLTRDSESQDMIDYIVRFRVYDMGYVYMYNGVGSYVRDLLVQKSTSIANTFKSYKTRARKEIEKVVAAFDKSLEGR